MNGGQERQAIGIDLGTTYSCAGVFLNGNVEIIKNTEGQRITPSYVAFIDNQQIVGDRAKVKITSNLTKTVFNSMRLIGRNFNEKAIAGDIESLPYTVINENDRPKIQIPFESGTTETFWPEEIASMLLVKMKESAEVYLRKPVTDAVITVPAHFNDSQRQATKDAGKIAGLNVMQIINGPTAAGIAYGLDKRFNSREEKHVLIFDLGGGTFDVSILKIRGGTILVKATAGDTHLGGEDFTDRLVKHFMEKLKSVCDEDITTSDKYKRAVQVLRSECEKMKCILSTTDTAEYIISSTLGVEDFEMVIERSTFDELCKDLFDSTLTIVKQALKDANLKKSQIDQIVLIGGSTRIPKIQDLLHEFFELEPLQAIHPDEAVAHGAAMLAAKLSSEDENILSTLKLFDATPLTLGIEVDGGWMSPMIERNATIPLKETKTYETCVDGQTTALVEVYEGEHKIAKENKLLGTFKVTGIPPAEARKSKIEITFAINENGIVKVSAMVCGTGKEASILVHSNKDRLSKEELEQLVLKAAKSREAHRQREEITDALHKINRKKKNLENELNKANIERDNYDELLSKTSDWLKEGNTLADKLKLKLEELEKNSVEIKGKISDATAKSRPFKRSAGGPTEQPAKKPIQTICLDDE